MKQLILLFCLAAVLSSCSSTQHEVVLVFENISDGTVSDVIFSTTDEKGAFTANALAPGEKASHSLAVANFSAGGDYSFKFVRAGGDTTTATGNYLERDYIKNTLTFRIVNEGVEVEKKVVRREEQRQANGKNS